MIETLSLVVSTTVPASELTEPKRITLTLDPGLVLERLMLERLSRLPRKRGQDWLRSLLAQGILAEGRWIRMGTAGDQETLVPRETAVPVTSFGNWLGRAGSANRSTGEGRPRTDPATPATRGIPPDAKPFAHLRKVIG